MACIKLGCGSAQLFTVFMADLMYTTTILFTETRCSVNGVVIISNVDQHRIGALWIRTPNHTGHGQESLLEREFLEQFDHVLMSLHFEKHLCFMVRDTLTAVGASDAVHFEILYLHTDVRLNARKTEFVIAMIENVDGTGRFLFHTDLAQDQRVSLFSYRCRRQNPRK